MMVKVIFYTLEGKFGVERKEMMDNAQDAFAAISDYAKAKGFTNIREVDDEDYSIRVTATTPGNRAGRNVGCIELGYDED